MTSEQLRRKFLEFFEARGHTRVASSPIVLPHDLTLLFVNAGMVQFKEVFSGAEKRSYGRAVTAQKCVRAGGKHNDLDEVGRTARHLTFFEMLGNFSFGEYFKKGAIEYAWEFLTQELALAVERLWFTVYEDDDDAAELWKQIGAAPERILRFGKDENFWEMGETGPCGPCSEIHYFRGDDLGDNVAEHVNGPGDLTVELWNLVFMQYERGQDGALTPLPRPQIDTGMGFERACSIVQGVDSLYETDAIRPIIDFAAERAGVRYQPEADVEGFALRVIADHARMSAFLISEGTFPGNEGRGYVLRKVMRRALWQGRRLNLPTPWFGDVVAHVVNLMGDAYPELRENRETTRRVVEGEERLFDSTLTSGARKLEQILEQTAGGVISGHDAFVLYDTHGLHRDLIDYMAESSGHTVDWHTFEAELEHQRSSGRASWKGTDDAEQLAVWRSIGERVSPEFVGYTNDTVPDARVEAIVLGDEENESVGAGQEAFVVLDRTPFYAEAGGQVGDRGVLTAPDGKTEVSTTFAPQSGLNVHAGRVTGGSLRVGDRVEATINADRRRPTRANHTATHLLHAALRQVLGTHVRQQGSLVAPDRLRFDFTHFEAVTDGVLAEIERIVNEQVVADTPVTTELQTFDEATASGAMALFGERYGERVRVVGIDDFSRELCGGTHVRATGEIGLFKIVRESAIASGVRRIEAITGLAALESVQRERRILADLRKSLNVDSVEQLPDRVEQLRRQASELSRAVEKLQIAQALGAPSGDDVRRTNVGGVDVVTRTIEGLDAAARRELAERLLGGDEGIVVLGQVDEGRARLLVRVSRGVQHAVDAGQLVRRLAERIGGRGGGSAHLGEAGGGDPEQLDEVLVAVPEVVDAMLEGEPAETARETR